MTGHRTGVLRLSYDRDSYRVHGKCHANITVYLKSVYHASCLLHFVATTNCDCICTSLYALSLLYRLFSSIVLGYISAMFWSQKYSYRPIIWS